MVRGGIDGLQAGNYISFLCMHNRSDLQNRDGLGWLTSNQIFSSVDSRGILHAQKSRRGTGGIILSIGNWYH
ncbi:hypothetical protein RRG08_009733 [Elysia crispata]|uniref:Uncharacterized protein n=1 Tax=Elysia crispata TaxID=231223 RepID=A0AAE1CSD9_9GAST|nr:hypothetical protein RRG08_009733 [Elysia crispata]